MDYYLLYIEEVLVSDLINFHYNQQYHTDDSPHPSNQPKLLSQPQHQYVSEQSGTFPVAVTHA